MLEMLAKRMAALPKSASGSDASRARAVARRTVFYRI